LNQSPKRWQQLAGILKENQSVHETELKKELINATVGLVMHITPDPSRLNLNDFLNAASDTLSDAINNWDNPDVDMTGYAKHSSHAKKSFMIPSDEAVKEIGELAMKKAKADAFNRAVGDSLLELDTTEETKNLVVEGFRNFSLKKFKGLSTLEDKQKYVKKHLTEYKFGQGSQRTVYAIGNGKVLKLARHQGSSYQNGIEIEMWKTHGRKFFPKIYDYDKEKEPLWIVSEATQVIADNATLRNQLTITNSFLSAFARRVFGGKDFKEVYLQTYNDFNDAKMIIPEKLFTKKDIELLLKAHWILTNTSLTDIDHLGHWGVGHDGRVVLVDAGV